MDVRSTKTMLNANQIFIICAAEDKEYVIALQKNLKERDLKVWSMFKDDGKFSVPTGDNHLSFAIEELKNSCMAVLVISKNSIAKGSKTDSTIYNEINNFHHYTKVCEKYAMRLFPVWVDTDAPGRVPDSWNAFGGINSATIMKTLNKVKRDGVEEIDSDMLNRLCNEIARDYYTCMQENYRYILDNKYNLVVLGNRLMQSTKTMVKTVSDDIRQTDENDSDSLSAIHLITNEISEYDCNAYALMIISANLLGPAHEGKYQPRKNGVKYYYYCPEKYLASGIEEDYKERIISFLKRDEAAITYADNSIRARYVKEKGIKTYLMEHIDGQELSSILHSFSIQSSAEADFMQALEPYDGDFYDSDDQQIQLPYFFFNWLSGRDIRFNTRIFGFMHTVLDFLKSQPDHDESMVEKLKDVTSMLDKIYNLHTYLTGESNGLTHSKFKSIAKKVICFDNDQNNVLIERWVIDRAEENEWAGQDMEEIVQEAMENIEFIPIKESEDFVLCNSFAIYDHKNKQTGKQSKDLVWYSTANDHVNRGEDKLSVGGNEEMLVVLNEATTAQDVDIVRNTLQYLKTMKLIDHFSEF